MLSKKDQAIKENIKKPGTVETFYKYVYVRKSNDAIIADPCHLWQGQIDHKGYGSFSVYSKEYGKSLPVKAHRFAYALKHGFSALPKGVTSHPDYVINHICHNTACVNPGHLEVITFEANGSRDKRKPKDGAA